MRFLILIFIIYSTVSSYSQSYFPVRINKKWGLIDSSGDLIQKPVYDAIGDFNRFGTAIMQRAGKVGLLGEGGKEIIAPKYDDLKVLDSSLIAVKELDNWMMILPSGQVIVETGFEQVTVLNNQYFAFRKDGKWGVLQRNGKILLEALYDEVRLEEEHFFLTRNDNLFGLTDSKGAHILPSVAEEINIYSDSLIFYKVQNRWGAVDKTGVKLIPAQYEHFSRISDQFVKLLFQDKYFVYSTSCRNIITNGEYDGYYPFSKDKIIFKKDRKLGLIDACGDIKLGAEFNEIHIFGKENYRVNSNGHWGVVSAGNEILIPFQYDYIAPLSHNICMVKKEGLYGIANLKGEEPVMPAFDRIELKGNQVKAYRKENDTSEKESMTLLVFSEEGNLQSDKHFENHFSIKIRSKQSNTGRRSGNFILPENNNLLENFEWFYSPQDDRYGLRKLSDGEIQIKPVFDFLQIERDYGFTIVGIDKFSRSTFERTTYRFERVFGIVNNERGLLVSKIYFLDIRLSDFEKGYSHARCVFSNGRHGLLRKDGKVVRKDYAYIGEFKDGIARTSIKGRLSGTPKKEHGIELLNEYLNKLLSPCYMTDFTLYDRGFRKDAMLNCEDCEWGYIDTAASIVIHPQYSYAKDFVNKVGIVECSEKWGMLNKKGEVLIPCKYDKVQFLENTDKQIVQLYINDPKYGMIDTLGRIRVNTTYDEIGGFAEGRLAVKRNGLWGFVNYEGLEVISCRFRKVHNFSEGVASVKLGQKWGFIDKLGNVEIDFIYRRAGQFKEELAMVYVKGGAGYINRNNEFIIPPQFDKAFDFEGQAARISQKGRLGLIDRNGNYILRPKYISFDEFDEHDLALVSYGANRLKYGLVNKSGELVTKKPFKSISPFSENLAKIRYRNAYGFIDTTGKMVITPLFNQTANFSEGRAAVQKGGYWGYIDKNGKTAVEIKYSKCLPFKEGKAVIYKGMRNAGIIDTSGNYILQPGVNRLLEFSEGRGLVRDNRYRFYYITDQAQWHNGYFDRADKYRHGIAIVEIDGKWGIINQKGMTIIPPKYDKIESFRDGFAKVRIMGFNGLSNLKGELIVQPNYEYISYAGNGMFRAEQGNKMGYFDTNGKWVWEMGK
ncbi:MAG: WG repeat-containing protein [Bacteroidetes bacterium]|nr:WG repeat-containing protein [Bacteroidota bacterium]